MPRKKSRRSQGEPHAPNGDRRIVNVDPTDVVLVIPPQDTFVKFLTEVVGQARLAWIGTLESKGMPYPDPDFQTWEAFRDVVVKAAEQYWRWGHSGEIPTVGRPDKKGRCFKAIVEGLEAMDKDKQVYWDGTFFPLVRGGPKDGKPLSQYALGRIIQKREPTLDEKTRRTYAKLWMLEWKWCEQDLLGKTPISQKEGAWLTKHFPDPWREVQRDRRKLQQLIDKYKRYAGYEHKLEQYYELNKERLKPYWDKLESLRNKG